LVLARPDSESPLLLLLLLELEPPLLDPLVALLELPLDPHAATATTSAIAATRVSVSLNGRMKLSSSFFYVRHSSGAFLWR
jgi:hypothetical protein